MTPTPSTWSLSGDCEPGGHDTAVVFTSPEQTWRISDGSFIMSSSSKEFSRSGPKATASATSSSKRGLSEKASQRSMRSAYSASSSVSPQRILSYVSSSVAGTPYSVFRSCARDRHLARASSWQAAQRNLYQCEWRRNSVAGHFNIHSARLVG
jgi:hypothetical protein